MTRMQKVILVVGVVIAAFVLMKRKVTGLGASLFGTTPTPAGVRPAPKKTDPLNMMLQQTEQAAANALGAFLANKAPELAADAGNALSQALDWNSPTDASVNVDFGVDSFTDTAIGPEVSFDDFASGEGWA